MKKTILRSMISLLLWSAGVAQDKAPKPEPEKKATTEAKSGASVDEILDRYLQAVGGKEAVEKLRSQIARASFESGSGSQPQQAEWIRKAPNRWLFTIFDDSGKPGFQQGSNGRQRWTKSPD